MSRTGLAARLARLEADRPPQWTIPLEDGGTLTLGLVDGLSVLAEGLAASVAITSGTPMHSPSPTLLRLGHARPDAADSLVGGVLIGSARTVRAHMEGAR